MPKHARLRRVSTQALYDFPTASKSPPDGGHRAGCDQCNADVNPLRPLWERLLFPNAFKKPALRPARRFALDQGT
jgi:hypothetical protein